MAFSDGFLDELTERTDLVELVSRYVTLKRRGNSHLGLCPFHLEKTPSFNVSSDKQLYHCFGCGVGGGAIQFAMAIERLEFQDAVRMLAERAGMKMPEDSEQDGNLRKRMLALHVAAARYYNKTLGDNRSAAEYLHRRGVTPATARRFGIGATPQGGGLIKAMTALGYTKNELLAGGLASAGKNGEVYDRFRDRLMFPILSLRNQVVGFGGRILGDGKPKYLNSSGTLIFNKDKELFALNFAKNSKRDNLILAEGYMDVVTLHQAGFDNAVAGMGTALTVQQAQAIAKLARPVVLAYDMDAAGRAAAERSADILRKADTRVSMLILEGAKDPDEFISKFGADALEVKLANSENALDYRIARMAEQHDLTVPEGKVAFLKQAAASLAALDSDIEREVYGSKAAALAGIEPEAVRIEIRRVRGGRVKRERLKEERVTVRREPAAEEEFVRLLLLNPEYIHEYAEVTLSSPFWERVWRGAADGRSLQGILRELSPEDASKLTAALDKPFDQSMARRAIADCAAKIKRKRVMEV
ncbi:hypothetical protein FACS1894217_09600 [Clostridia bacterium]|nr:hypothetical protein FACS1894217_09600 [Clostridia bacterium]